MGKLLNFFNITEENYAVFLRLISIILFFTHAFLMICCFNLGITALAWLNIGSLTIYAFCSVLSFLETRPLLVYNLILFEVLTYSFIAVYYTGAEYGFHLYGIAIIAYGYLTKYVVDLQKIKNEAEAKKYEWVPISIVLTLVVYLIELVMVSIRHGMIEVQVTPIVIALKCVNYFVPGICVIVGCGTLAGLAIGYARKSVENIHEMEVLVEEVEKANDIKSTFLANMSHEIRTPMNAICGMADLLADEELSEESLEYVGTIKTSGSHLLAIINDLLDFSKIESGKQEFVEEKYVYNTLVRDVINMISTRMKNKPISLLTNIDDNIPGILIGDQERIRQVIINIMNNAVKFTDAGSITLKSYYEPIDEEIGNLHFEISDTGRGIKEEDIGKLFNAFEQVDRKKNGNIEGTGLGLSICKMLVNGMAGKIFVESEYEKGSTFHFFIKQKAGTKKPCNYSKQKNKKVELKRPNIFKVKDVKVLIVDDNRVNLKVAAGLLKKYGIVPVEVNCGKDAIEVLKKEKFDIVFMDHLMPEMDGVEATKEIRELNDYCRDGLVIIALSANAVNGMEQLFLKSGMDDFLAKPIETDKLSNVLKKWIPKENIIENKQDEK